MIPLTTVAICCAAVTSLANFCTVAESERKEHSERSKYDYGKFIVELIPALSDNYMYVVIDKASKTAAAVDPVEPKKVLEVVAAHNAHLKYILTTNHHSDHAGGNKKLVEEAPGIEVLGGGDNVEACNRILKDNEEVKLGDNTFVRAITTPCDTKTPICYHVYDNEKYYEVVFTGDTLSVAGVGKFSEGNGARMLHNLNTKLGKLDEDCKVYSGHEYGESNLAFARSLEPNNTVMKDKECWAIAMRKQQEPLVPSTIQQEKVTNPFMRIRRREYEFIRKQANGDLNKAMDLLREHKNNFRG